MGMKNGAATLMHLPKGQTSEMEPLTSYKIAPRHYGACIALCMK